MKPAIILVPLAAIALASCDKAKNLADKASSAVKEKIANKAGSTADKADDELRKLVDQTNEGVIFRKDLPFPAKIEVRVTRRSELAGRFFQSSAIEKRSEAVNGTRTQISKLERAGDQIRHTLEKSDFSAPDAGDPDAGKKPADNPLQPNAPQETPKPVTFRKSGGTWKTNDADGFHSAALAKQLGPVLDQLLIEDGLSPKPVWFSKRRVKQREKLTISGDSLSMLFAGNVKGTVSITLDSFESVGGHPCGVFLISGDYSRKQFPDFDGTFTDEEVTIQSGKLWLSLIHPLVLREELDTIRTFKSGGQGGMVGRGQGTAKISVTREWKKL